MDEKIRISVVIPVYNAQESLPQCLESVLGQNISEIEILCVDDGSSDGSAVVLERFAARDARVRVFSQPNQFAGAARNRGMQHAKGEYLAFLDADDCYLPGALERLYRLAQTHQLDFVKGRFVYQDGQDGRRFVTGYARNDGVPEGRVLVFRDRPARLLHAADVPWNGLYRRTFLEKNGIQFNHLRCSNDHSFYIHCLLCAERLLFSRKQIACYRVHQAGSLVGRKALHFETQLENYHIVRDLCRSADSPLAQQILRCELDGVLDWYERLRSASPTPERLKEQLRGFLQEFDENDVGESYLRAFPFRETYFQLRYGTAPPGRRPTIPVRLASCWKEHGWRYTCGRFFTRCQESWHGTQKRG